VTFAAQRTAGTERRTVPNTVNFIERSEPAVKIDPMTLRAAKQIYRQYVDSYASQLPRPLGVAINQKNLSGKLVYSQLILLPMESFVPIEAIETPDYPRDL
jgi:hypothetical protein